MGYGRRTQPQTENGPRQDGNPGEGLTTQEDKSFPMADPQSNAALPAHPLPEHSLPAPPELPPDAPRAGVLHVRHRHTERYTVVGNHLAQHPCLSATAIGIGVHIQSLPDGVSVTIKALTLRFPEGEVTIGRALKELEAAGCLVRRRVPLGGGRIATRTFFLDHPGVVVRDSVRGSGLGAVVVPVSVPAAEEESERQPVPVTVPGSAELSRPHSVPASARTRPALTAPVMVPTGPAADLLARLRLSDTRLLLSERDIQRLVPAVETGLARAATPDQITRTLTAGLPSQVDPIRHPASFLEYRLTTLLPPPLPTEPLRTATATPPSQPVPLVTCDGFERAIRTHDPRALCRDCRKRHGWHKAEPVHSAA
ncbi:hypothetical protein ACFWBM_05965 [Streptomyces sp. NPDC059980]|uniref:hypothetical protein n=1 Tax=Streptomyces sp. NPDC059980 TaxID=3347022 RepID=UPI0036BEC127